MVDGREAALWLTLLAFPRCAAALCSPLSTATAMQRNTLQQDKVQELDEAAWKSRAFWAEARRELPGFDDDPAMLRFRGFCENLMTCEPGDIVTLENGQELFTQYTFPGIDAELLREPFPPLADAPAWAGTLAGAAAVAQEELLAALAASPLHDDDAQALSGGSAWSRAAWYRWQFTNPNP